MKKTIFILAAVALSTGFMTSCKKEYTCVCTVNGTEVHRVNLGKQKRSDAKNACENTYSVPGVIAKCEIQ